MVEQKATRAERSRRRWVARVGIVVAITGAIVGAAEGWTSKRSAGVSANEKAAEPSARSVDVETSRPAVQQVPRSVREAASGAVESHREEPLRTLADALSSTDISAKLEAVEALVERDVPGALDALQAIRIAEEPEAAPTIIMSVATLASRAPARDRDAAVSTLSRWLREESKRDELDAVGNVPNIVEALGQAGGRDAAMALVEALEGRALDLSVQTLAVQKLEELGDRRAAPAIARFANRVSALAPDEETEPLRVEAIEAARDALEKLGG